MEKVNGGTLESFIKKRRTKSNNSIKMKTEQRKIESNEMIKNGLKQESQSVEQSPKPMLKPTVIPENLAATITRDICNGLFQIHKKNFIHRDLKPENILINENLNPDGSTPEKPEDHYLAKIADFGLSAEVHSNVFRG